MTNISISKYIPKIISIDQAKDTGMAMVLIILLISSLLEKPQYITLAIFLLLINMVWPIFFKSIAKLWIGLSLMMGTVMSTIILSIVFFLLVVPVGMIRKSFGKDSMQLKKWKNGRDSVLVVREHEITLEDIQNPY